jgi:hypothetical protein
MSLATTARPNANGNLFEIRTVQSAAFRTLIEALKEILTEANLEFDTTGIRVIDVDSLWDSASIFGPRVEKMNPPLGPGYPAISSSLIDSP